MRYDYLFAPVADGSACGPDLDELGDEAFLNYTLGAEDRFPSRYYDIDSGAPIELTIDLRSEVKTIAAMLERSRDLRLLVIEARFQALSGQIVGFSDCIQAIAGLVSKSWQDVHPRDSDGDFMLRQNTLGALNSRSSVVFPLHNAPIVRDRRFGTITYRSQAILDGEAAAVAGAKPVTANDIAEALSSADNAKAVAEVHAGVTAALQGLRETRQAFVDNAGFEYAPDFDELRGALEKIGSLIERNVPALAPARSSGAGGGARGEEASFDGDGDDRPGESADLATFIANRARGAGATKIGSHAEARSALTAAERYFAANESSSPALILVNQARLLIGKPLVLVVQALAPDLADRAVIRIDSDSGFQLDMHRMRSVTEQLVPADTGAEAPDEGDPGAFVAGSRAEAEALLLAVEAFHKAAEPSSPVPSLLEKARSFLNQDFRTILKSLLSR